MGILPPRLWQTRLQSVAMSRIKLFFSKPELCLADMASSSSGAWHPELAAPIGTMAASGEEVSNKSEGKVIFAPIIVQPISLSDVVFVDEVSSGWVVTHSITGERLQLPAAEVWELAFGEDGSGCMAVGVLENGTETMVNVQEQLKTMLTADADGTLHVTTTASGLSDQRSRLQ